MIDDIGSGALGPGRPPHVGDEPTATAGIAGGAHLVLFSGDKLLGGPQCGVIAGSTEAVALLESHPLRRALRLDKLTLAALEATLTLALDTARAIERIPLWSMIAAPVATLSARAAALAEAIESELGLNARMAATLAFVGGGSAPIHSLESAAVLIGPPFPPPYSSEEALAKALRQADPPVVARVQKGTVLLDLRTVTSDREGDLLDALRQVCHDQDASVRGNGPPHPRRTPAAIDQP